MTQAKIVITATVSTTATLSEGETIEDLKQRWVDIYLHDSGMGGHTNKTDLGTDTHSIKVLEVRETVDSPWEVC